MSQSTAKISPPPVTAAQTEQPRASATTCVVGCKLPHGLKLELKGNDGKVATHTLKGANAARIIGGYGLTEGIPTEFMEQWLRENAEHPAVRNQSVFMHSSVNSARAHAKDARELRTGLEAINPIEDAKRFKLDVDREAEKAYRQQVAENPVRDRQIRE